MFAHDGILYRMDEIKQPGPLAEVEALYDATPRLLAFQARTREEFSSWHEELQAHVAKLLRVPEDPYPLRHYVLSKRQMEGYSRERVILKAAVGGVPLYVLRPDGDGPFRPVIALHGHGPGVRDAVGLQDGEEEEAHVAALNTGFAVSLVQRGFLVFAPEQLGFGDASCGG